MSEYIARWQQSISEEHCSEGSSLVANLFDSCDSLFASILNSLSRDKSVEKSTLLSLERSRSYLVLWADGFGVSDGRFDRSLDKSRRARGLTQRLLVSICRSLTRRLLHHISTEAQIQLHPKVARTSQALEKMSYLAHSDAPDIRDSDDDNSDSDSESDNDTSNSESEDLEEIAEDLRTDTQCLLDLGSRFEEEPVGPVVAENPVNPEPSIPWNPSEPFSERILRRYPDCDTTVAKRLGKISWNRLLRCQEAKTRNEHSGSAAIERTKAIGDKVAGTIVASTAFNDSGLGSSVPTESYAPNLIHYEETIVSYHGTAGASIRVPALSDEAKEGAPFSCVGCGRTVNITNTSTWKKHLFFDLQPYVCLHNECSFNETAFMTKAQWIEHLSLDHDYSPKWEISECSMCHKEVEAGKFNVIKHLSQHLEEISLMVLPTNAEESSASDDDSDSTALSDSREKSPGPVREEPSTKIPNGTGVGGSNIDEKFQKSHTAALGDGKDENVEPPLYGIPQNLHHIHVTDPFDEAQAVTKQHFHNLLQQEKENQTGPLTIQIGTRQQQFYRLDILRFAEQFGGVQNIPPKLHDQFKRGCFEKAQNSVWREYVQQHTEKIDIHNTQSSTPNKFPGEMMPPQTHPYQNEPLTSQREGINLGQGHLPVETTPVKTVLKALPTVRHHTTALLGPDGDEYHPQEIDEAGEKKILPNGQLLGGREYRCRVFYITNRGPKLFMLATECARVLGYRDSYLLFNKNRALYKIIASQEEKDDLVSQEVLPFTYRSRQIAIVTARSMFRQFGSRIVVNGRRVRDDYWEEKARKQGFTEADPADLRKRVGQVDSPVPSSSEIPPNMTMKPRIDEEPIQNQDELLASPDQSQFTLPNTARVQAHHTVEFVPGYVQGPHRTIEGASTTDMAFESPEAELMPMRAGCDNCLRRHLKCDGRLPSCTRCLRSKKVCPGYLPPPRAKVFEEVRVAAPPPATLQAPELPSENLETERKVGAGVKQTIPLSPPQHQANLDLPSIFNPSDKVMWSWDRGLENHLVNNDSIHSPSEASKIPSSSSNQQEQSEPLGQELQCPFTGCGFRPTGRPEKHEAYLWEHISTHSVKEHECEQCGKKYARRENLSRHRGFAHGISNGTEDTKIVPIE
ncbi:hypothetical protein K449DRAFT_436946 [Hypoxylon sp. EC38]|nr:hypothetical protein K449DRAFT_436946 [Hypoxylon sp. EC38]